jgi:hypothetical protein
MAKTIKKIIGISLIISAFIIYGSFYAPIIGWDMVILAISGALGITTLIYCGILLTI